MNMRTQPVKTVFALCLASMGGALGFPINIVFAAGALKLLWEV